MLELIQQSALASVLRNSVWLYPFINAGHILGIALLVGSIVPLDLRVLGLWPNVPLKMIAHILQSVARVGICMAFVCGLLLFICRPTDYVNSPIFLIKLIVIFLASANALVLSYSTVWQHALAINSWGRRIKVHASVSLLLWIIALLLGRFVAYR